MPRQKFEGHTEWIEGTIHLVSPSHTIQKEDTRPSYHTSARRRADDDLFKGRLATGMELEEWQIDGGRLARRRKWSVTVDHSAVSGRDGSG
jgi:hypothetical protein